MAKVKKGSKVRVHGRTCTVKSVVGGNIHVTCGPPTGKKRRSRKSRKGRGIGAIGKVKRGKRRSGGTTCGIPAGLLNRLPTSAADQLKSACLDAQGGIDVLLAKVRKGQKPGATKIDVAAMAAAHKLLAANKAYTKKVLAQEKKIYKDEVLARLYAQEAAKPKAKKVRRDPRTIYSRNDPRFDPGLAGTRKHRRKSRRSRR